MDTPAPLALIDVPEPPHLGVTIVGHPDATGALTRQLFYRSDTQKAESDLKAVLAPLNYRNLDDVPEFKGSNTTTEFLSKHIFDGLAKPARAGELGRPGRELKALRITLSESHLARAQYEAPLW